MSTDDDQRWYAFVRVAGDDLALREGYVFEDYEQARQWRERTEAARCDVVASGLIPEAIRERTRRLAGEHRAAEEAAGGC